MTSFDGSTHQRLWLFTPAELIAKREEARTQAIAAAQLAWAESDALEGKEPVEREYLTSEQERVVLYFFEVKAKSVLRKLPVDPPPPKVIATMLAYFKRFFLLHSLVEWPPERVMATCACLAYKVEEVPVSLETLVRAFELPSGPAPMLALEPLVLSTLRFSLVVHHSDRALAGLLTFLSELYPTSDLSALKEAAQAAAEAAVHSDAVLRHPPSAIALAALVTAARELAVELDAFLTHLASANALSLDSLRATLADACETLASAKAWKATAVTKQLVAAANDARRKSANPARDPASALSIARAARAVAESDAHAAKRARKRMEKSAHATTAAGSLVTRMEP